jgi:uncharacterized repeat protein (TIGR02543 family)
MKKFITLSIFLLATLASAYAQNISSGNITIATDGAYTITGTSTTYTVKVNSGVTATITLNGVSIDVSATDNACAFDMTGATVNLTLTGANTLNSGENKAGLQAPSTSTLVIGGTGSLTATGGIDGTGIGGGRNSAGGTITIGGNATVIANGDDGGAGIGGCSRSGGTITIGGNANVTANGGGSGAGIGGGDGGSGGTITVNGGSVTATGGYASAGIGGGNGGSGVKIIITGGSVTATGGTSGAGIGGGAIGYSGIIIITGGTVAANGTNGVSGGGAGIGGSSYGSGSTIIITADNVTATPGGSAEPVGHGDYDSDSGNQINLIGAGASANMIGNVTLPQDITIPAGKTLTIPAGQTLTVPAGITLTNNGTINNCAGTIINNGTITGNNPVTCPNTVLHAVTLTVNKDGTAWSSHGKTFTLRQGGLTIYTGVGTGGTVVFHAGNGTYDIYDGDNDTGADVTVSNATTGATLNYYTVTLTVKKGGSAWNGHGKTFTLRRGGATIYTGVGTGGTVTFPALDGTYDLYDDDTDTGTDVTVSGAAINPVLDYFTVTFNPNGGSIAKGDTVVNANRNLSGWAHVPTRAGFTFGGWYTDNGTFLIPWNIDVTTVTSDITLHAKWQAKVTFIPNGGSIAKNDTVVNMNEDLSGWAHLPTLAGFIFGGWYTDNGVFSNEWILAATLATRDTTLYAKWQAKVTFNPNGGSIAKGDTAVNINEDVSGWAHLPTRAGYTFGGWYTDNGTFVNPWNIDVTTVTQNITLHAKWQTKVTFNTNGGSIAKIDTVVDINEDVSGWAHVPTLAGFTFGGWYTDNGTFADDWNIEVTLVTQDTTLHAKWQAKVTFDATPGSIAKGDTVVDIGEDVGGWAHVPTRINHTFVDWYTDNTLTTLFLPTGAITGDSTVYAKWDITAHTVAYLRKPGVPHTTQPVNHGSPATAPSVPDSTGYAFDGWYADGALTTPFNFAGFIMHDSTLHAKWTLVLPPETLEICGQPLPPVEGAGTKDDPFTAAVTLPIDTEKLTPADIYTGDDADAVTIYTGPDYTQSVSRIDLYPGETVTVYIAVKVGNTMFYYAVDITRSEELIPVILRSVTLPYVDGVVTNPPAGLHQVFSGRDFVFTITPTDARSNTPPVVRTGRADTPDGVRITPNADGTYTVRIRVVRIDITLNIDLLTATESIDVAKVWSYGHTLYIYATTAGTARIYSLTGQLVKTVPYTADNTAQTTLPRGLYIVVTNGQTDKIIMEN